MLKSMKAYNLNLRPNCILTKTPFVFISGPRSLLHYQQMGEELQIYIKEHGYEVISLPLSFRSTEDRKRELQTWLNLNRSKKFHFLMAQETWQELTSVFSQTEFHQLNSTSSFTLIGSTPDSTQDITPRNSTQASSSDQDHNEVLSVKSIQLKPMRWWQTPLTYHIHQLFCHLIARTQPLPYEQTLSVAHPIIYDRFLDRCIELAENDYQSEL